MDIDHSCDPHPPDSSQELVSFHRPHNPSFRLKPIRFNRHRTVGSLRVLPVRRSRKRRLWATVAAGCSFTSLSRNLWCSNLLSGVVRLPSWEQVTLLGEQPLRSA